MSKHLLEAKDLENFEIKTQIAGAFGDGNNKSLNIVTRILDGKIDTYFTVEVYHQTKTAAYSIESAIKMYNSY